MILDSPVLEEPYSLLLIEKFRGHVTLGVGELLRTNFGKC